MSIEKEVDLAFLKEFCRGDKKKMTQYIHLLSNSSIGLPTDLWVPTTGIIKPEQSWQGAIGLAHTVMEQYEVSVEGYYKRWPGFTINSYAGL